MINVPPIKTPISEEAVVLTKNLLFEIDKIVKRYDKQNGEWITDIVDTLRFCESAGEGLNIGKVYALYAIAQHWDDLSLEFRMEYSNQFNVLVTRETSLKPETLGNYFRTVETYLINDRKPFGRLEIPKRDRYGKEVVIDGEVIKESIEFDPLKVGLTKLTVMRSAVEAGNMNLDRWTMLADPGVKVRELQTELYVPKETTDPDPSLKHYLMGNVIVASEFGREIPVGTIDFSLYGEDELATNSIRHICRCLGIKLNVDMIDTIKTHGFLERYNPNEAKVESKGESN
jgi:hypothetical protein